MQQSGASRRPASAGVDRRADGTFQHNPDAPEITPNGVNISALRRNLTLTPQERIETLTGWAELIDQVRGGLRRSRRCRSLSRVPGPATADP